MTLKTTDSKATPRATPNYEWDSDTALKRIEQISVNARTTWFGLLALMTFVLVTLLGVQDVDFFGYGRFTQLPLVNVQVPTELFFWAGPPLAAATYAYFHFYLLRLWDALGRAPATHQGDPFSEHVFPWLLTDAALRRRPDAAARRRALGSAAELTSLIITWLFGLIVLFFAWWRSMVAHDPALSTLTLICFLFAATAGMTSWVMLHRRVARRVHGPIGRLVWRGWRKRGGVRVAAFLVVVTLFKTWWGHPEVNFVYEPDEENIRITVTATALTDAVDFTRSRQWAGLTLPEFRLSKDSLMSNADLTEASITIRPSNWVSRKIAEGEARKSWCNRQNLAWDLCIKSPIEPHQEKTRLIWCKKHLEADDKAPCDAHFAKREEAFQSEWKERRDAYLAVLKKPDLKNRDLRAANLANAFLPGVDLRQAQLDGADLSFAQMEGANLSEARLQGANLSKARLVEVDVSYARLEGANLSEVRLVGANLWQARLQGANLIGARLDGATLWGAQLAGASLRNARLVGANLRVAWLEGANLRDARLEGANLRNARLEGANLSGARLEGANLSGARLEGANLSGARLEGAHLVDGQFQSAEFIKAAIGSSLLNSTDFTGAKNLTQDMLEDAVGNENTILPMVDGDPLYVWSCWEEPPPNFEALLELYFPWVWDRLREDWLCGPEGRKKTGRTAEVDGDDP